MRYYKIFLVALPFAIFAKPQGLNVKHGSCDVKNIENNIQMKCSDKSILEWDNFSIRLDEKVKFSLPSDHSAVLNKVVKDIPSEIFGSLECNGKLYLVNPSGIIFGKDSVINCKELIASTLKIRDEDFLKDKAMVFENEFESKITHLGYIKGKGDIYLLSKQIEIEGDIQTEGKVTIVAANKLILKKDENIYIELNSDEALEKCLTGIEQNGKINASEINLLADGMLYNTAIKQSNVIEANTIVERGGRVLLCAENGDIDIEEDIIASGKDSSIDVFAKNIGIIESASITASSENNGGNVNIRSTGGYVFLGENASINADANTTGDGGNVYLYSDDITFFHGNVFARGGEIEGNGGFVEVSGLSDLHFTGDVTTKANNGFTGTLLIDPTDITINNNATTLPSFAYPPAQSLFTRAGPTATLNAAELVSQLQNNNVEVNTTPGAGGPNGGRIVVNAPVQWTNGFSLTLNADENIIVNADIITGIGGALEFNATNNVSFRGVNGGINVNSRGGDIDIQAGNSIILSALDGFVDVKSLGGNLNATASNNVTITASSTTTGGRAILGNQSFLGSFGDINVNATNVININGGTELSTNAGIRSNDGGGDIIINCSSMNINGGSANDSGAAVFSSRDVTIDTGSALGLTAGTVGEALIFSDTGSITIDVGTAGAANLTLTGNSSAETIISADSVTSVTSTQTINATNARIASRQDNETIDAVNQINLVDSEFSASDILTIQNANLLTLDNSSVIGVSELAADIPTINASNDSLIRGDLANVSGNNLNVDDSAVRSPNGDLTLDFNNVVLTNQARVFSGSNFVLNGRNLSLDENSTIISDGDITITQTGVANDVQVLGTTLSSAVRSNGELSISTDSLLVDNSALESFSQNIIIDTVSTTDIQNSSFIRANLDLDFTTGSNFTLDDSAIVSTSSGFTSNVTGSQNIQSDSSIQASGIIDLQATSITLDASELESASSEITYSVANNFNINNSSTVTSLGNFSGSSTNFSIDNSTLSSLNNNVVISADNFSVTNGSQINASTNFDLTVNTSLTFNNGTLQAEEWILSAPTLTLTDSLVQTEDVQFNISTLNLSNSQLFIGDSLIEQP